MSRKSRLVTPKEPRILRSSSLSNLDHHTGADKYNEPNKTRCHIKEKSISALMNAVRKVKGRRSNCSTIVDDGINIPVVDMSMTEKMGRSTEVAKL